MQRDWDTANGEIPPGPHSGMGFYPSGFQTPPGYEIEPAKRLTSTHLQQNFNIRRVELNHIRAENQQALRGQ
jgi:hypothetical protein